MYQSNQEVFDIVCKHLLTQNRRSSRVLDDRMLPGCAYRGKDGLKCAIGCLIPDHLYKQDMERRSVEMLVETYPEIRDLFKGVSLRLLTRLQKIHDHADVDLWEDRLETIKLEYCFGTG